jgi:hypothetical protein
MDDKALLFMRRTIGKFPLGGKGKIDHNICGFEDFLYYLSLDLEALDRLILDDAYHPHLRSAPRTR